MNTARTAMTATLAALLALSGCGKDDKAKSADESKKDKTEAKPVDSDKTKKDPPAKATKDVPAKPKPVGEMKINSSFLEFEKATLDIGTAHAYISDEDQTLKVELISDQIKDIKCYHDWGFGEAVENGQLAIQISTSGFDNFNVPFTRKPAKLEHVGYHYYWRPKDREEGTNSGGGAKLEQDSELDITAVDDKSVEGTLRIADEITATFVATICPPEEY